MSALLDNLAFVHSPDFNPIEMAFAKLKELLRQAQARTVDALWDLIGRTLDLFTQRKG